MTIWRIWTVLLVVLVGGTWLLAFPYSPKPISKADTVIHLYRAMGIVPEVGEMTLSDEIGHDVFEVPKEDAMQMASMSGMAGMGGMDMGGMEIKKDDDHAAESEQMAGMEMKKDDDHAAESEQMVGMEMKKDDDHADETMTGMAMKKDDDDHGAEAEEGAHGGGGVEEGLQILATGTAAEVDAAIASLGEIKTVSLNMTEWGYEQGMLMGVPGDIIRLKIKNVGKLPHEFMIMDMASMGAVAYRQKRADWNLVEHEAMAEIPIIMPGDSVDMVVQIHKDGTWGYMCMFPYHMQMGMMGMLMTPEAMQSGGGMMMKM